MKWSHHPQPITTLPQVACPSNSRDDPNSLQCVPAYCPCEFHLLWPHSCQCSNDVITTMPTCPDTHWFSEEDCACVCPRFATCPEHYKWDTEECGCFCDPDVECSANYEWDVSQCKCVCNRLCPYGKVLRNDSCTCKCEKTCDSCELQNPSTCECETYAHLLTAMSRFDTSVESVSKGRKYEYRRPY